MIIRNVSITTTRLLQLAPDELEFALRVESVASRPIQRTLEKPLHQAAF